ncbi:potassium channel family protein [Flexithrix dorotheae]|uniref:potassium channel family protein n=1 Tax=Flexithrix dorotheae TaxID=70993 RepID=UPI0003A9B222|nr:potassium channel protein [Flexithrix dorotheae]
MNGQIRQRLKRLFFAFILLIFSLFVGITGLMVFEGLFFWDAFYLSVIIISTVGMNEVGALSDNGRIFISFYIIFNLSIFAYFISVITKYVFEGELREIFQTYMVTRVGDKMKNHTIVCGYGKNGIKACEELFRSRVPFALIEFDYDLIDDTYADEKNVYLVQGDATHDEVLIAAGILKADTIITTLPKDADNVFVTLTAKELNPGIKIISRASEESSIRKLQRAGADHVVMPDAIGGHHMATLVTRPEVIEFLDLLNGVGGTKLQLDKLRFEDMKEDLKGKSIRQMNLRDLTGVNIIGYKDKTEGFIFNPNPDTVFKAGDVAIVLGGENDLTKFKDYCYR